MEIPRGEGWRHESHPEIALDTCRVARPRRAETAAARRAAGKTVAGRDLNAFVLGSEQRVIGPARPFHLDLGGRSRAAALDAVGLEARPVAEHRKTRLAAPQPQLVVDTQTAAIFAGPDRIRPHGITFEEDGGLLLHHFERRRLGKADRAAGIRQPVAAFISAGASA